MYEESMSFNGDGDGDGYGYESKNKIHSKKKFKVILHKPTGLFLREEYEIGSVLNDTPQEQPYGEDILNDYKSYGEKIYDESSGIEYDPDEFEVREVEIEVRLL